MLNIFGKKSDKKSDKEVLEIELAEPVDCVCDFTYNFHWQHQGNKLDPTWKIPGTNYTFGDLIEHLKNNGDVRINGDAGHRLCSSMGVDLQYFGGSGGDVPVGDVYVEGDVDTRMGISMIRGSIYVKGDVKEPVGNVVRIKSNVKGYKKFISITDITMNNLKGYKIEGCRLEGNKLFINDGMVKDTVGARLNRGAEIVLDGNVDLSTGILMRNGTVQINGNAGKNTGALLNGGTVIINGDTDDFTAIDMISGTIIVNGNAGKFLAANKKKGKILAKKGSPIPPSKEKDLDTEDHSLILRHGFNPRDFVKFE